MSMTLSIPTFAAGLGEAAIKGALILTAAALLSLVMHRRSAAARHALWTGALTAQLLLLLAAPLLPRITLPVIPAPLYESLGLGNEAQAGEDRRAVYAAPPPAKGSDSFDRPARGSDSFGQPHKGSDSFAQPKKGSDSFSPVFSFNESDPAGAAGEAAGPPPAVGEAIDPSRMPVAAGNGHREIVIAAVAALWLLGVLLLISRHALGTARVARLARSGERVEDGSWLSLAQRLANRMQIGRPLTILRGRELDVPVTWGVIYPVVLLPAAADEWPAERRRVVLLHEMAHVKRLDAVTQLIAQISCALFWFNPLVWVAVRRMRVEREHACDDYVLRDGTMPSNYAGELLTIVRSIGPSRDASTAFAALAMARRGDFEDRMLAILDPRTDRHALGAGAKWAVIAASLLLVLPLAAMRPAAAAARVAVTHPSAPARDSEGAIPAAVLMGVSPQRDTLRRDGRASAGGGAGGSIDIVSTTSGPDGSSATSVSSQGSAVTVATASGGPGNSVSATSAGGMSVTTSTAGSAAGAGATSGSAAIGSSAGGSATGGGGSVMLSGATGSTARSGAQPAGKALLNYKCTRASLNTNGTNILIHGDSHHDLQEFYSSRQNRCVHAFVVGNVTFTDDLRTIASLSPDGRMYFQELTPSLERVMHLDALSSGGMVRRHTVNGNAAPFDAAAEQWLTTMIQELMREGGLFTKERVAQLRTSGGVNAVLREVSQISSSSGKRRYLTALIESRPELSSSEMDRTVRQMAAELTSSSDLRTVLTKALATGRVSSSVAADAVGRISSSSDRRVVLQRVLKQPMDAGTLEALLRATQNVSSSSDKAAVLVQAAAHASALQRGVRSAYFAAVNSISSSADHRRVLTYVVRDADTRRTDVALEVLRSATRIASSSDKASVLVSFARKEKELLRTNATVRDEYLVSARSIGSDSDARRALNALER